MINKVIDYLRLLGTACIISAIGFLLLFFTWARWGFLIVVGTYIIIVWTKYKTKISHVKLKFYTRFAILKMEDKNQLLWDFLSGDLDLDRCTLFWKQDWIHRQLSGKLTLLHLMAGVGNKAECRWLLACKADPNAKDDNGLTPLDYAKKFNETEVIKLLENYSKK